MDIHGETICPYCGVGCRLRFDGRESESLRVRGVENAEANRGGICAKGAQLGPAVWTDDRLARPQFRLIRHDGFIASTWDETLRYVGEIFRNILNTYGPEAIGFYGSGQLDTETAKKPIIGFIFSNKGLMYNLTFEGSKITKIDKDK